jgi:hypothetical protein
MGTGMRLTGGAVVLVLALSGCSIRTPGTEPLDTAIPKAFLASDLPIADAQAGKGVDGLSVDVWASAEFETGTVTADQLSTMLRLAVENTHLSDVNTIEILASEGPYEDGDFIDLGPVGVELGFEDDIDRTGFSADWDDVVAYLDE